VNTQPFPVDCTPYRGECVAPLHDGNRAALVVEVRLGLAHAGPIMPPLEMCADCLANFALVRVDLGDGVMVPFVVWHEVKGTLP